MPAAERMGELQTIMQAIFAMVAQVGAYSIPAERQKNAEQVCTPASLFIKHAICLLHALLAESILTTLLSLKDSSVFRCMPCS